MAAGKKSSDRLAYALEWLEEHGTEKGKEAMARYAIHSDKAFGVMVRDIRDLGKELGRDHALALALWETGWYEAKMLSSFVDDPALVTPAQMDKWAKACDNWAEVDTICFHLFDKTPHAWKKVEQWAGKKHEWMKRAAFALLWGLTVHDKRAPDANFLRGLELIEKAAIDERHFVKKAVNMALRATGKRNPALRQAAIEVATRLAASKEPAPRWIGKDALSELRAIAKKKASTK